MIVPVPTSLTSLSCDKSAVLFCQPAWLLSASTHFSRMQNDPKFAHTTSRRSGMPVECRWNAGGMPVGVQKAFYRPATHPPTEARLSEAHSSLLFQAIPTGLQGRILPMESFGSEIECFQSPSGPVAYDAFRCRFPKCNARYQRKEHLNRHERSNHIKQQVLVCSRCGGEFRRRYHVPDSLSYNIISNTRTLNLVIPFDVIFRGSTRYENLQSARLKLV